MAKSVLHALSQRESNISPEGLYWSSSDIACNTNFVMLYSVNHLSK